MSRTDDEDGLDIVVRQEFDPLVPPRARYLLPIIIHHCLIPPFVVCPSQRDDLVLEMSFLTHQLVDLVVEVADLVVGQSGYKGGASASNPPRHPSQSEYA